MAPAKKVVDPYANLPTRYVLGCKSSHLWDPPLFGYVWILINDLSVDPSTIELHSFILMFILVFGLEICEVVLYALLLGMISTELHTLFL